MEKGRLAVVASLVSMVFFLVFWIVWKLIGGSVPAFHQVQGIGELPFSIPRWWDILGAAPIAAVSAYFLSEQLHEDFVDGLMGSFALAIIVLLLASIGGLLFSFLTALLVVVVTTIWGTLVKSPQRTAGGICGFGLAFALMTGLWWGFLPGFVLGIGVFAVCHVISFLADIISLVVGSGFSSVSHQKDGRGGGDTI